jgi:ribosomal protein L37E
MSEYSGLGFLHDKEHTRYCQRCGAVVYTKKKYCPDCSNQTKLESSVKQSRVTPTKLPKPKKEMRATFRRVSGRGQ